jgi:hypothetical protein
MTTRGAKGHKTHLGRPAHFFINDEISLRVTYQEEKFVLPPNTTYADDNPKARPYIWASNSTYQNGFQLLYSSGSGTKEHIYKANSVQPSLGIGESLLFGNPLYWIDSGSDFSTGDITISNASHTLINDIDQIGNKWSIAPAWGEWPPIVFPRPEAYYSAWDYPVMQTEIVYYSNVTPNVAVTASGKEWGDVASGAPIDMPFLDNYQLVESRPFTALLWITTNADGSPLPLGESKMYTYFANTSFNSVRMVNRDLTYTVNCGLGNSKQFEAPWELYAGGGGPEGPNNCSWVGMDTKGMWVNSMGGITWTSNGIWGEGQHWP